VEEGSTITGGIHIGTNPMFVGSTEISRIPVAGFTRAAHVSESEITRIGGVTHIPLHLRSDELLESALGGIPRLGLHSLLVRSTLPGKGNGFGFGSYFYFYLRGGAMTADPICILFIVSFFTFDVS
jgi:hypothetical protein